MRSSSNFRSYLYTEQDRICLGERSALFECIFLSILFTRHVKHSNFLIEFRHCNCLTSEFHVNRREVSVRERGPAIRAGGGGEWARLRLQVAGWVEVPAGS